MDGITDRRALSSYLRLPLIVALLAGLALFAWPAATGVASTTIVVNSTQDKLSNDGLCTLREAIIVANKDARSGGKSGECPAGSGADTIILPAGTYTLNRSDSGKEDSGSTGDLDITSNVTISSTGPGMTIIDTSRFTTGFNDRIFHILSGNVTLSGVIIKGGNVAGDGSGIYNNGALTVTNSTVFSNTAGANGGGIYNAGTVTLINVTISGNTGKTSGGGLFNNSGTANLNNVTIATNIADSDRNGTGDGGGIFRSGGTINLKNTLVGANVDNSAAAKHADCSGMLTSQGHNLLGNDTGCVFSAADGDQVGTGSGPIDPRLGPLQNNGGPTPTHALLAGSRAIDAGDNVGCPATDQRGLSRPRGLACDIGAYETSGNDSWTTAFQLTLMPPTGNPRSASVDHFIDKLGQSKWYSFTVEPNSKVIVKLTNLPANYDLTLYKDIAAAFQTLDGSQDLLRLGVEFAPDAFSPDAFSPDAFSPDAFSPDAFSPDAFSPDAFSPDAFSPDAFSSAQTRSLIGVSAFEGIAGEGIIVNTWDNSGDFYVRVRGRNGAFSLAAPFHLEVTLLPGSCSLVSSDLPASNTTAADGDFKTIILTDLARMAGTTSEKSAVQAQLATLAARSEVAGVVVNVGADARVAAANAQADDHPACPFAKNLVAQAIRDIVDSYRAAGNPLEYVVIVGNDDVIPFFRHPDRALLASEKNFAPPVRDNTASQASLKLGYVLSQDDYGAGTGISLKTDILPIPELAVGRLVETAADVTVMLNAYLSTAGGVVPAPASALVTGYDFLADAAQAIQDQLEAGTGAPADTLITPRQLSPQDPAAWTADDLREQLLDGRHDLIFLAGHFSANSALAADYSTRLLSTDVVSSPVNLTNAIIFSAGCHAGYNIVTEHGVPGVTREPDWAQAFAVKGATLIAGTGYQYGDTDFIEYSERLYLEFSRQLRAGTGPVAIGKALVAAKQAYLAGTPQLRGIHEKAFLEATLFGLPMLSVNLPAGRGALPGEASIVAATTAYTTDPGATLGLKFADMTLIPSLITRTVVLTNPADDSTFTATYLSGSDGVVANPSEPVLPLETRNVGVPNLVLRGVGFRDGRYADMLNILPLLGVPTTEIRGIHAPFRSDVFYPIQPWRVNYFDALAGGSGGVTSLAATPAQLKSSAPGSSLATLRRFDEMNFRLYYSSNVTEYANDSVPALSAPPEVTRVSAVPGGGNVTFRINVVGNPAAGIQEVWVTYSATSGPFAGKWQSLNLVQNAVDSTLWEATLTLSGTAPENIRYMVQAVNGVGLVTFDTNLGASYVPRAEVAPSQPTLLSLEIPAASGAYGTQATFRAVLTGSGTPLAGQTIAFGLGSQRRQAITDGSGRVTVTIPLLGLPGQQEVRASFAGTSLHKASFVTGTFTIISQGTALALDPQPAIGQPGDDQIVTATLTAADRRLIEKTVFFEVTGSGGSFSISIITDYLGRAVLGDITLPAGDYSVTASFNPNDDRYGPSMVTGMLSLNNPPDCSTATASIDGIWPPDNTFIPVNVLGVTDLDGDPITITIDRIFQDEPVGNAPDGRGIGTSTAEVRAERDGNGNGRVYHIFFAAGDGRGGTCSGVVRVPVVPHDQGSGIDAIDGGPLYDSTVPG